MVLSRGSNKLPLGKLSETSFIRPDQFNFLFHGLILPKYESVGRQKKKKKKSMNLINIDL